MNESRPCVVVTPEQVEIRLRPAGLGRRALALVIDFGCAIAVASALGTIAAGLLPAPVVPAVQVTVGFVVLTGWHVLFELRHAGRTPAKRLMGLRVVDVAGLPLLPAQSIVRNVARALDALPAFYGVGAAAAALDPWRRRVGDRLAGTLVIAEAHADAEEAHRGRELAFNSLEDARILRRLRKRLAPEERDFVLALDRRAPRLDPAARYDLMEEAALRLRATLEIDDPRLSAEGVVKGVAALVRTRAR